MHNAMYVSWSTTLSGTYSVQLSFLLFDPLQLPALAPVRMVALVQGLTPALVPQGGLECCVKLVSRFSVRQVIIVYHSTGSLMDGAPPGPKTNRDHSESFCVARFLHYDQWGNSTSQNVGQMLLSGNSDVSTQSWVLISEKIILQKTGIYT